MCSSTGGDAFSRGDRLDVRTPLRSEVLLPFRSSANFSRPSRLGKDSSGRAGELRRPARRRTARTRASQFGDVERFDEVVVGSDFEAPQPVVEVVGGGHEHKFRKECTSPALDVLFV